VTNKQQVPAAAQRAVKQAPQSCLVAIGGSPNATIDQNRLSATTAGITWYDGRSDKGNVYQYWPAMASSDTAFQVFNKATTANATTLPAPGNVPTPNVVLWSGFWNETAVGQLQTLWHEITHVFTRLDDPRSLQRFNIFGPRYPSIVGPSQNYDDWLNRDNCPTLPPPGGKG